MATKKQEKQETQVAILTPKKVRGTATIYACGDVEFKAYGEGTPQKEVLKRKGNSQLYETKPVKGTIFASLLESSVWPPIPIFRKVLLESVISVVHSPPVILSSESPT